jgi:hypothetical protein
LFCSWAEPLTKSFRGLTAPFHHWKGPTIRSRSWSWPGWPPSSPRRPSAPSNRGSRPFPAQ